MSTPQNILSQRIGDKASTLAAMLLDEQGGGAMQLIFGLRDQVKIEAATAELQELRVEIRKREAVGNLLSAVSIEALTTAGQAGFAKWWHRDGMNVMHAWLLSRGWHMSGSFMWTDGENPTLEAHLIARLYAAAVAPAVNPLCEYWEAAVVPVEPAPIGNDPAHTLALLSDALAAAWARRETLPAVDESTAAIVNAAGASVAFHSPDHQPKAQYLVSHGWQRISGDFNFALPNGTGGNFGAVALHKQMDEDFEPFVKTWPQELARAERPIPARRELVAV